MCLVNVHAIFSDVLILDVVSIIAILEAFASDFLLLAAPLFDVVVLGARPIAVKGHGCADTEGHCA